MNKNYYEILEVSRDMDFHGIKEAYKKKLREYQELSNNKEETEEIRQLKQAYKVLGKNIIERFIYEQQLESGFVCVQEISFKERLDSYIRFCGFIISWLKNN